MAKNQLASLEVFFHPKSVAVIGASAQKGKVGNDVILNLINSFSGPIYPVNLKDSEIEGLTAYPSILKIKDQVDLAIIVIPSQFVADALIECAKKNCKNVVIISSGFKETGPSGQALEEKILQIAKKFELRILGPNCLGYISNFVAINASFAAQNPLPGNIAFVSQSGALGTAILDKALAQKIGIGYFISIGNKADINEIDLLEYLAAETKVKVIMMYLEEIKDGRQFMKVASRISKKKPIIIFKAGKTEQGQKAVSSHTGSIAGSAKAYNVAFCQSGIIEAEGVDEFFSYAKGFSFQTLPTKNRIAVITNAGGPGIIMTDLIMDSGMQLAKLTSTTMQGIKNKLPAAASVANPIDILGDAKADRYGLALDLAMKDENVDCAIVVLTPQKMTEIDKTAEAISVVDAKTDKTILLCFMGEESIAKHYSIYHKYSLPQFDSPSQTVKVINKMWQYYQWQQKPVVEIKPNDLSKYKEKKEVKAILNKDILTEVDVQKLLSPLNFPFGQTGLIKNEKEAIKVAKKIGYPLALKVVSPEIIHKSDVGGVKIGIKDDLGLTTALADMAKQLKVKVPQAKIEGYLISEMVKGFEIILGVKQDPQFGPLLMVGAGGIYTEIFKDVAFRLAPINKEQALMMIKELKIYPVLAGARGQKVLDIDALAEVLVKLSDFAYQFPEIKEIDFNPVMLLEKGKGAKIVDARFIKR
ncbi:MAG: acetate--CoA ligase family protein [Patescibacteria group bacterium]